MREFRIPAKGWSTYGRNNYVRHRLIPLGALLISVAVFAYFIFSRLYIIWKFGYRAFGYDTGIYRHNIIGYYDRLGDPTVYPFAFSHFSNALMILKASPDMIMYGWYFLISLGIGAFLYILMKKWFGVTAAILAILLFSTSLVQFEFYQWYYYRNLLAVFFLFLFLYLFEYKSYLIILPLIVIGSIHPPSFVPIFLSLFIYAIFKKEDRKYLIVSLLVSLLSVAILNWRELSGYLNYLTIANGAVPVWQNYLASANSEFTGQFINFEFFWQAGFLYIPFALVGAIFVWRKIPLVSLLTIISGLLIIIGFVLYRRYFVYLDIFLIILAAGWVGEVINKFNAGLVWKIGLATGLVFLLGRNIHQIYTFRPLITEEEFTSIQEMAKLPPNKYIMTLSSYYAPWLYGFGNHEVIAPGMFEANKWSKDEWMLFWNISDPKIRKELFQKYQEKNIYVFIGNMDLWQREQLLNDPSFTKINHYLWNYHL